MSLSFSLVLGLINCIMFGGESSSGSTDHCIKVVPTHGGRYIQYNVYGQLFEVSRKYVPPICPIGRGACGIVCAAVNSVNGEKVTIKKIGLGLILQVIAIKDIFIVYQLVRGLNCFLTAQSTPQLSIYASVFFSTLSEKTPSLVEYTACRLSRQLQSRFPSQRQRKKIREALNFLDTRNNSLLLGFQRCHLLLSICWRECSSLIQTGASQVITTRHVYLSVITAPRCGERTSVSSAFRL
uniref:Protein kinase domain-containing protein n=1 Tax=Brassica oleracea TaxID=3712 RepID=A0A3P6A9W9_BRAOL|nr:unnamed protein product [Brassica oleracea]